MTNEFDFDTLEIRRVPVKWQTKNYFLCEADAESSAAYNRDKMKGATLKDGKVATLPTDPTGAELVLLASNLYHTDTAGKPTACLNVEFVKKWPNRITHKLIAKLKEISELEDDLKTLKRQHEELGKRIGELEALEEDPAKNELDDTEGGSD